MKLFPVNLNFSDTGGGQTIPVDLWLLFLQALTKVCAVTEQLYVKKSWSGSHWQRILHFSAGPEEFSQLTVR